MSGTRTVTARPAGGGGRGARERILTAATTLFHREGIHATGVERLTEYAHVSKRTFYQHFSSKNDLVEEYLRRIHQPRHTQRQAIDTTDASPRARILAVFDSAPGDRFRGCPFHNAAVEAADAMPGVEDIVHEHKLDFTARLIHTATEAGPEIHTSWATSSPCSSRAPERWRHHSTTPPPCYTRDRPPKRSSMPPPSTQGNDEAEHPLISCKDWHGRWPPRWRGNGACTTFRGRVGVGHLVGGGEIVLEVRRGHFRKPLSACYSCR